MFPSPLFVETLTPSILWRLWSQRRALMQARCGTEVYVLYRAGPVSRWMAARLGWRAREIEFDFYDDVRRVDGSCATQEVFERAPGAIVKTLEALPAYREAVRGALRAPAHEPYAQAYLAKRIGYELGAAIRSVVVAGWYARSRLRSPEGPTLLLREGWQSDLIGQYGSQHGVRVKPWLAATERGMGTLVSPQSGGGLRGILSKAALQFLRRLIQFRIGSGTAMPAGSPLVAAEMYLNGTRTRGPYNSDLFWYRGGCFSAGDVIAYFRHPKDQPKGLRAQRLRRQGITPVGRAQLFRWRAAEPGSPGRARQVHAGQARQVHAGQGRSGIRRGKDGLEAAVERYLEDFYREYDLWVGFCRATGARIHVSMYKQFPENEPRHAAFRAMGGLSVTIQRSVEREPHLFRRTVADVHFGHSREKATVEQDSGSRIRQFVIAGYPFDYAFPDARRQGLELRARLRRLGVKFIIGYFDQNEGAHRKIMGGRSRIQEDYHFLAAKVAADPELGLLLKPKKPATLAARLGPVWGSLEALVQSGRCILLEGGDPESSYLPCVASTGADVTVNLLYGGTAGLESWLSGTRSLLLAAQGAEAGVFSRLPPGCVVFDSWPELWKAVERVRKNPADRSIGNWEPVIEDFANLRDGRASERIGQHIAWLQEALRCGKSPEEALQEAAKRYELAWGSGWIFELNPETGRGKEAPIDAFAGAR